MTNKNLQTATRPGAVATAIAELQDFIAGCRDAREARKALAVKLVYQDYLYEEIQIILDVSLGSITGWKQAYEQDGVDGLRLNHKGKKSYLSSLEREEVLRWLQTKDYWELGELEYKLAFEYDVVYESKQSYYDLFDAASISWNKTTKLNPKADADAVAEKKKRFNHCWQTTATKSKQES
ncbi:transposase [Kalymmatonema gypsitolerans NIES-4073]|nr:transposase [Scytonema sp. NIES-4073]